MQWQIESMTPDERTFERVLAEYQGKVLRLCYAMLSNRSLAEETTQEVFVRIWRALGAFRGEAALSTWIYSITRNACFTALKKAKAARAESLDDPKIFRRAQNQEMRGAVQESRTDVRAWLAELPESQRQALTLFYLEEKSYEEVAAALNAPMGTIKTWIYRGRHTLAEKRLQQEVQETLRSKK
jgi:RNA polymerase sigma-70 factor, ECF subfamily